MAESACRIDIEEDNFVVRLRRDLLGREEVSRFLDYLELESVRRKSRLSEADAAALASEIDRAVWEKLQERG